MVNDILASFVIKGEFPEMNEIIAAAKVHFAVYSTMKKKYTGHVQSNVANTPLVNKAVEVTIYWYTKNEEKDPDNVSAGIKFILDGLKEGGVIPDDTRKWIKGINHKFPDVDKKNPRVEIYLTEALTNGKEQEPKETKTGRSNAKGRTKKAGS